MCPRTVRKNISTADQSTSSGPNVNGARRVGYWMSSKASDAGFAASEEDSQR